MNRREKLQAMLEDSPMDTFLHFALAKEYEGSGAHTEAVALYKKVIEIQSDYLGAYYHLAQLLAKLDQVAEARSYIDQGLHHAEQANASKDIRELLELQALLPS